MFRFMPAVAVILLFSFCSCPALKAQSEAAKFSDFAKQIPHAQTEIFALHNLVGHAESVLRNKALTHSLEEGKLAEVIGVMGNQFSMKDVLDRLEENRRYVPDTAAISVTPDSYAAIVDLLQFLMRLNMAEGTNRTDDFDAKELATLEEELAEIAGDFKLPEMTVWVQWPDAKTTTEIYEKFQQTMKFAGLVTELEFYQEEHSFQLRGMVADIDQDGYINLFLDAMGVEDKNSWVTNAMLDVKFFLRCERVDSGMRISIGNDHKNKNTEPVALASIKDGSAEIAYGQWNSKKLLTAADKFEKDMARWADKDLGKLFRSQDIEDTWASMTRFSEQVKLLAAKGQMRVWAAENQVHAKVLSQGVPEAESLTGQKLLNLIPANVESFHVDSHYNMGEYALGVLDYMEDKLATQSLKSDLRGNLQQSELLDEFASNYYEHFGPFRSLLIDELAKIDSRPMAFVIDTKGSLDALRAETKDKNEFKFKLETDNLLRMAGISACENPEQYQKKLMEAYQKFVAGVLSVNGIELPSETKLFQDGALSNGAPTKVFSLDWLADSELLKLELTADFQMHTFIHDGHVVFSSSLNFSESLVGAGKDHLKIPAPKNESLVTSRGHIKGRTIGNAYGVLLKALLGGLAQNPMGDSIAEACTEFGEIMNHIQWATEQKGESTDSSFVLDFKG